MFSDTYKKINLTTGAINKGGFRIFARSVEICWTKAGAYFMPNRNLNLFALLSFNKGKPNKK